MPQGTAFRRPHQIDEQLTLKQQAIGKFFLRGSFNRIHAFERCGEVFGHALDHVAGKLEIGVAVAVLARQVGNARQWADVGNRLGKGKRFIGQRFQRRSHSVKQFLARDLRQQFAFDRLATDNHVQRRLDAQGTRQALRAARARQQAKLDFRQGHAAARRGDAVLATQCQLQSATHAHRVNGGHHRFCRVLQHQNHAVQIGLLQRFVGAEFLDVGAARKRLAGAGDDDGLDGLVIIGFLQVVGEALARGVAQTIDRGVAQCDQCDRAMNFVESCH